MSYPNYLIKTYTITTNQMDAYDDLSMIGILDVFQDIAGRHAYLIKAGFNDMLDLGLYWVIARNQVKIIKTPPFGHDVTVKTWPLAPTRFYFDRLYELLDENGDICIMGRSRWLIIDKDKRKMQASSMYRYPLTEFVTQNDFDQDFPSIRVVKEKEVAAISHIVLPSEIDHNKHFNNTRYAELIYNVLGIDHKDSISEFLIYYHSECYLGDPIDVYVEIDKKDNYVSGYSKGNLVFTSLVTKRESI